MSNFITELPAVGGRIVANERLWLTADRKHVVPEGHPDAAFLFASEGKSIPRHEAERLGLVEGEKTPEPKTGGKDAMVNRLQAEGEVAKEAKEETETTDDAEIPEEAVEEDLDTLSYRELQERCKQAGISAFGSKDTLMKRLHDVESSEEEDEG